MKRWLLLVLLAWAMMESALADEPMRFIYHREPGGDEARNAYSWRLLEAALERTRSRYGDYVLAPSAFADERPNAVSLLKGDGGITVSVFTPRADYAGKLVPARVPIDRGVLGYRLLLIHEGDQARFATARTLDDLKSLKFGALASWADVAIMKHAGLSVVTGDSFEGLFRMLTARRFDALSRGAGEIAHELAERRKALPGVVIERSLILHYPMPVYFWFRNTPEGRQSAARVEAGLWAMQADGSFEAFFRQKFAETIARIEHDRRLVIELDNPLLGDHEPLKDKRLWYRPAYH